MSAVNGAASKPDSNHASADGNTLEEDVALLASLLSDDQNEDIDETNISDLLRRLDTAHGVASGVENRLDEILNNLDGLLGSLEDAAAKEDGGALAPHSEEKGKSS